MKIWLHLDDHDEDEQFSDRASHELLDSGVHVGYEC
jgi:hypothetical protein